MLRNGPAPQSSDPNVRQALRPLAKSQSTVNLVPEGNPPDSVIPPKGQYRSCTKSYPQLISQEYASGTAVHPVRKVTNLPSKQRGPFHYSASLAP